MNVFVVPAYDEEANLPRLLVDLESRPGLWSGGRVIVVDDGSRDATAAVAGAHPGRMPVEVISIGTNQGPDGPSTGVSGVRSRWRPKTASWSRSRPTPPAIWTRSAAC